MPSAGGEVTFVEWEECQMEDVRPWTLQALVQDAIRKSTRIEWSSPGMVEVAYLVTDDLKLVARPDGTHTIMRRKS